MLESYFVVEKHAKKKKKRFQFRNNIYSTHNVLLSSLKKSLHFRWNTVFIIALNNKLSNLMLTSIIFGFFFFYPRRANFYISEE